MVDGDGGHDVARKIRHNGAEPILILGEFSRTQTSLS